MFPLLRRHQTLWAAWVLGSAALLFASPVHGFGWAELLACTGSLVLALDERVRREALLAVGLPALALIALLDPEPIGVARLALLWGVFAIGVVFGARALDDGRALERIAGQLVTMPQDPEAVSRFEGAVTREIGRARRHERSFALLSVAPLRRTGPPDPVAAGRGETSGLLEALAEARMRQQLFDLLTRELHVYADVVMMPDRVLALVPETDARAIDSLEKRLAAAALGSLGIEMRIGTGVFPRDAVCVEELIQAADAARERRRGEVGARAVAASAASRASEEPRGSTADGVDQA